MGKEKQQNGKYFSGWNLLTIYWNTSMSNENVVQEMSLRQQKLILLIYSLHGMKELFCLGGFYRLPFDILNVNNLFIFFQALPKQCYISSFFSLQFILHLIIF